MADIINFQQYVNSKEEEKKRIKRITTLSTIVDNVQGLLHNINDSLSCSLITKHLGEMNQIIGKENILDSNMLSIIVQSLSTYCNTLHDQIDELNDCCITTIIRS